MPRRRRRGLRCRAQRIEECDQVSPLAVRQTEWADQYGTARPLDADTVASLGAEPRGRVRVTAPVDLAGDLATATAAFLRSHPQVQVDVLLQLAGAAR